MGVSKGISQGPGQERRTDYIRNVASVLRLLPISQIGQIVNKPLVLEILLLRQN